MEGSAPGMPVAPREAAEALRVELAGRAIAVPDGDVHVSAKGTPLVSLGRGLVVAVEADRYTWETGRGVQAHPSSDAAGAALLLEQAIRDDVLLVLQRQFPRWTILRVAEIRLYAVPACRTLTAAPAVEAATPADLMKGIHRAERVADQRGAVL